MGTSVTRTIDEGVITINNASMRIEEAQNPRKRLLKFAGEQNEAHG